MQGSKSMICDLWAKTFCGPKLPQISHETEQKVAKLFKRVLSSSFYKFAELPLENWRS
jgi:hypothetical protein